jgi:uncharacterized 2Fe-2S/4Fe-4S cluster protein (DUF4445 family)
MSHFIDFEPVGRRGACPPESTLLDSARLLGVGLASLCGGAGECGGCVVQLLSGEVSEPRPEEINFLLPSELAQGYRLACRTTPRSDCRVRVPLESLTSVQRTQVEGEELAVLPEPVVRAYSVALEPPTLSDLRADAARLTDALREQHGLAVTGLDLAVLREIPNRLREGIDAGLRPWHGQAVLRENEVIGLLPDGARPLGLAVDLGTTKIATYLVDLAAGQTLASRGLMNPQIPYGEDIIARITFAERDETKASLLQDLVVQELNEIASEMCAGSQARPEHIVDAVIVGNTAMHHLLLGLPVRQLARSPYIPAAACALDLKARELGLRFASGCYVHLPAVIAGFVGADHVAMLLATEIESSAGAALAIDIGTNTEICLFDGRQLTSASCASGPAFEGAHIKHGMRAADGAIERLRLTRDGLEYQAIGGAPAVGLCGSGILDALAQLRLAGVLDEHGRMHDHPRVRETEGEREFVLIGESELAGQNAAPRRRRAITFTQKDVRQLQLAKAAMRAGIELLLRTRGRRAEELQRVIIAGAFGSYIDIASAIRVGMLPELPLSRFRQVGNAAGMGAKLMLISRARRSAAQALAGRIGYLELAAHPGFAETFTRAMALA